MGLGEILAGAEDLNSVRVLGFLIRSSYLSAKSSGFLHFCKGEVVPLVNFLKVPNIFGEFQVGLWARRHSGQRV